MDNSYLDIESSLNSIFSKIFSSLDNSFFYILDNIAFINETITDNAIIKPLVGSGIKSGILAICNSFILGFLIFFSIRYLFSHIIYTKSETAKEFVFKLIIFSIFMNNSLWICKEIIKVFDICSSYIIYTVEEASNLKISFSEFINIINKSLFWTQDSSNLLSFSGIVKSFSSIGLVNLIFTFSLRYIMIIAFIIISPFAFLSLSTQKTSWIFTTWIKSFLSLLFYQVLISIILSIGFSFGSITPTLLSSVFYVGIILALQKSGYFISSLTGSINISSNNTLSSMKHL